MYPLGLIMCVLCTRLCLRFGVNRSFKFTFRHTYTVQSQHIFQCLTAWNDPFMRAVMKTAHWDCFSLANLPKLCWSSHASVLLTVLHLDKILQFTLRPHKTISFSFLLHREIKTNATDISDDKSNPQN